MPSHVTESIFLKDFYGTDEMRQVFDDKMVLQCWLDAEVALAQAEAEVGLIPKEAAEEIARKAKAENINTANIKKQIDVTLHPLVPFIREFASVCDGDAGEYIHWGATTQDIMDTAKVMQVKKAVELFEARLPALIHALKGMAEQYKDTVMAGRTHGQHALPITFGLKAAVWLSELLRHRERLEQLKPRVLVGQFFGAAGTLASLPNNGLQIQEKMLKKLGLGVPDISWHSARDGLAEFASFAALTAGTGGKIAREIISLQKTEFGEVEESFQKGMVGSSTMPQKRNPFLCEAIFSLSKLVISESGNALQGVLAEHERDWSVNHMEWSYLPQICIMTDSLLVQLTQVISNLSVHPERMAENLQSSGGLILSEAVMLELAQKIGRQSAHHVVQECAMKAIEEKRSFKEVLLENQTVAEAITEKELDRLLDPKEYTGYAKEFVEKVISRV